MKKSFICFYLILVLLGTATAKNKNNKVVGFDIGLTTGIPVYSSSEVRNINEEVNDGDSNRIIVGLDTDINFKIGPVFKYLIGFDLLTDFNWSGSDYANHLDYGFNSGLKCYPGFGGLNLAVLYSLGMRSDFLNTKNEDTAVYHTAWGNGFKICLEYDFLYGTDHVCMPSIGFYYKFMPRGHDNYDNMFAFYANLSF